MIYIYRYIKECIYIFNFLAIGYISTYSNINSKHQYHPNNMLVSTSPPPTAFQIVSKIYCSFNIIHFPPPLPLDDVVVVVGFFFFFSILF